MKPFPWRCATCRERAVQPTTLSSYVAELEHDGRNYQVVLNDLEVLHCENCGTVVLNDEAEARLDDALRAQAGLLGPAEIRNRRQELGLTQKQLADRLGIAMSTLCRWEAGAQIQQRCMDKYLRLFFEIPEVRRYLGVVESQGAGGTETIYSHVLHD